MISEVIPLKFIAIYHVWERYLRKLIVDAM